MKKSISDRISLRMPVLIVMLLFSSSAIAQTVKAGDTITTKRGTKIYIKDEQSSKMKLIVQAKFFDLQCGTGDAFKVGVGFEGDYYLPKMASAHISYVNSFWSIQKMNAGSLNKGSNALAGVYQFELGGRFHLVDMKARKRFKTKLSHNASFVDQYNSGNTIPEKYLIARLPARRILAIRGGLYRTTTIANTDMNSKELSVNDVGAVKTKDGTVFSEVYYTNAHTTGVYVGISEIFNIWTRIKPQIDEFEGHTYIDALLREVYADVLLAHTSFDPFVAGGHSYEIAPNTAGSFQTLPIGFRVGKTVVITRKTFNLGFSFEIGDKPGVKGRGAYFGTGMSLAFVK